MDSLWLWLGFNLFVLALLAFDLGVLHRKERTISVREAIWLSAGYVALAAVLPPACSTSAARKPAMSSRPDI